MTYDKHDIVYNIVVGTSFLSSYEVIPDYVSGKSCYVGQITEITASPDCIYETRDKKLAEEVAHHFGGSVARSEKVEELYEGKLL